MLYQFTFENFKSYKEETIFDMRAENIKEFEDTLIIDKNGTALLPVSVIYGPNAGGKSGLLEALVCLISLVLKPKRLLEKAEENKEYRNFAFYGDVIPYKLDKKSINKPTKFEIYFSTQKNEYKYNLSVLENKIIQESLYKKEFKGKKPAKIFERNKNTITLGETLKKSDASTHVNETMPYISFASITTNNEIMQDVMQWFENITAVNYAKETLERQITIYDNEAKKMFLELLANMGIDICDYRVEREEDHTIRNLFTKHKKNNEEYELEFKEESVGTKKLFNLIPNIMDAILKGGLFIFDELDAKLHPKLLRYVIMLFKNKEVNKYSAQLLFTSQDLTTMNNQVFRRDEIWFAYKNEEKESEIYSLYEIRDENGEHIRANASFNKQYLTGKYGADPYLAEMLKWRSEHV